MLVNQLAAGEEILEQLAFVSQTGSFLPQGLDDPGAAFKTMCSKAREAWALAVFSGSGKASLGRYFTYHLKVITVLAQKLSTLPEHPILECSCFPPVTINSLIETEINCLTDHLLEYFGMYPDGKLCVPHVYRDHVFSALKADLNTIKKLLVIKPLPPELKSTVLTYLDQTTQCKPSVVITFRQLAYFKNFITGMNALFCEGASGNVTVRFMQKMLELEFNQLEVFCYFQDDIRSSVHGKTDREKIEMMEKKHAFVQFSKGMKNERCDDRWLSLSGLLSEWLTMEIMDLKAVKENEKLINFHPDYKLKLEISVAHLACLLRLFGKENIFGAAPLTTIFRFFSEKFSTKRAETFSPGGLSKEYYGVEQVTASEMRALLLKMVGHINRDYFPVVVAVSIIIGVY